MIVVVNLENHLERTPDGSTWTHTGFPYSFWTRYLSAFDGVRVVARVKDVPAPLPNRLRVDGPSVTVGPVPDYLGPWQYLRKARATHRAMENVVGPKDAVIMRVASQLANCMFPKIWSRFQPYGLEVVNDPWDIFAPGVVKHLFRPFFRKRFTNLLRKQCAHACAAAYVTQWTLQERYPVRRAALSTVYSSVQISDSAADVLSIDVSDVSLSEHSYRIRHRPRTHDKNDIRLVMVGTLSQRYKGTDVAIKALAKCIRNGLNASLTIVGDGTYRRELERQAAGLGLAQRVVFRGQLPPGEAVCSELDGSDLFIMPSRTEGLPRALIEAMARGLPCIGSRVGGIPELLDSADLVPPGNAPALAAKIGEVVIDPQRMARMSARNLARSKDFSERVLNGRRTAFYAFVRKRTEEWLARNRTGIGVARPHVAGAIVPADSEDARLPCLQAS